MKIEMGESLVASWLRHCMRCQIVQTNWKASFFWSEKGQFNDEGFVGEMLDKARSFFKENGLKILSASDDDDDQNIAQVDQARRQKQQQQMDVYNVMMQTECDTLGISISPEGNSFFLVESAFHSGGLGYKNTDLKVAEKMIRDALALYYFIGIKKAKIIFASPKIKKGTFISVKKAFDLVDKFFRRQEFQNKGIFFEFSLYLNEPDGLGKDEGRGFGNRFTENIFVPVLRRVPLVDDTSELFARALSMNELCTTPCEIIGSNLRKALRKLEFSFDDFLDECKSWKKIEQMIERLSGQESGNMRSEVMHYIQWLKWDELGQTNLNSKIVAQKADEEKKRQQNPAKNLGQAALRPNQKPNRNVVGKASQRIPSWAGKVHGNPYKIIRAFLLLQSGNNGVPVEEIKRECSDADAKQELYVHDFDSVWSSLKTDAGNSYGKVFVESNGVAKVAPEVQKWLEQHRDRFLA